MIPVLKKIRERASSGVKKGIKKLLKMWKSGGTEGEERESGGVQFDKGLVPVSGDRERDLYRKTLGKFLISHQVNFCEERSVDVLDRVTMIRDAYDMIREIEEIILGELHEVGGPYRSVMKGLIYNLQHSNTFAYALFECEKEKRKDLVVREQRNSFELVAVAKEREEQARKAIQEVSSVPVDLSAIEDNVLYSCKKCKSRKVFCQEVQLRSADKVFVQKSIPLLALRALSVGKWL